MHTPLIPDDGFYFGLMVFETLAIEQGTLVFPKEHLRRLAHSLNELQIQPPDSDPLTLETLKKEASRCHDSRGVLKIAVSEKNRIFSVRENLYRPEHYQRGFHLQTSAVRRNETSPLTYHKTGNYGINILEKRRARTQGFDEPVFLNTKGQICEGATSNLFFIKNGRLYTPAVKCGLLPGIIRGYLMNHYPVLETEIYPEQIPEFDEIFLTNSLLGIMPAASWDGHLLPSRRETLRLFARYRRDFMLRTDIN